mgnify:FL=1
MPGSVPLLVAMADGSDVTVARRAVQGLGRTGKSNPGLLDSIFSWPNTRLTEESGALKVRDVGYVDTIVHALGHLDDRRGLNAIERASRHADHRFGVGVVAALSGVAGRDRYTEPSDVPAAVLVYATTRPSPARNRAESLSRKPRRLAMRRHARLRR